MSANLTDIERETLTCAVSHFAQKLNAAGYKVSLVDAYIGRDHEGELFYEIGTQRPDGFAVAFRLTLTTPHGS
jgi:hypothetical protein